jgi:hypothetical protein
MFACEINIKTIQNLVLCDESPAFRNFVANFHNFSLLQVLSLSETYMNWLITGVLEAATQSVELASMIHCGANLLNSWKQNKTHCFHFKT